MRTDITFKPASISITPSTKKYYGVTQPGYEHGSLRDRAFIAAWSGYPEPTRFVLIHAKGMTAGSTWDRIAEDNDKRPKRTLSEYITFLMENRFQVIEFSTARELFEWLADCGEIS